MLPHPSRSPPRSRPLSRSPPPPISTTQPFTSNYRPDPYTSTPANLDPNIYPPPPPHPYSDYFNSKITPTPLPINSVTPETHNQIHKWGLQTRTLTDYYRIEQIGEGTYGQVYKARHRHTHQTVALKKIRVHNVGHYGLPPTIIREIKILKKLRHPNMVEMIEVVTSKGVEFMDEDDVERKSHRDSTEKTSGLDGADSMKSGAAAAAAAAAAKSKKAKNRILDTREKFKGNMYIVLEYVSHDLTGLMDMAYRFSEVQVKCIFRQLLEVLAYMHENKYVHRDIKCSNILMDERFRIKLADFGLARSIARNDDDPTEQHFTNKVITLWYRPPEILLGSTTYTTSVDMWSAGCILAELILGRPLFPGKTEMEQLNLIFDLIGSPTKETWEGFDELKIKVKIEPRPTTLRIRYGSKIKGAALSLLEKLLALDPNKRISASSALSSRYFICEPKAPLNPEELGVVEMGGEEGNFHEFQTKKRRREAKVMAEKAAQEAKQRGLNEREVEEESHKVYLEYMNIKSDALLEQRKKREKEARKQVKKDKMTLEEKERYKREKREREKAREERHKRKKMEEKRRMEGDVDVPPSSQDDGVSDASKELPGEVKQNVEEDTLQNEKPDEEKRKDDEVEGSKDENDDVPKTTDSNMQISDSDAQEEHKNRSTSQEKTGWGTASSGWGSSWGGGGRGGGARGEETSKGWGERGEEETGKRRGERGGEETGKGWGERRGEETGKGWGESGGELTGKGWGAEGKSGGWNITKPDTETETKVDKENDKWGGGTWGKTIESGEITSSSWGVPRPKRDETETVGTAKPTDTHKVETSDKRVAEAFIPEARRNDENKEVRKRSSTERSSVSRDRSTERKRRDGDRSQERSPGQRQSRSQSSGSGSQAVSQRDWEREIEKKLEEERKYVDRSDRSQDREEKDQDGDDKDRDSEKGTDDREKDNHSRSRSRGREYHRKGERECSRERDRDRRRDREKSRDRDRGWSRDRDRSRSRDRSRDRGHSRSSDRNHDRYLDERDRHWDRGGPPPPHRSYPRGRGPPPYGGPPGERRPYRGRGPPRSMERGRHWRDRR